MSAVVTLKNVTFSYNHVPTVENLSFTIDERDFLAIVGPNGGGKTTILKLIMGFLSPHSGQISVFGKTPIEARKYIGYVPQYADYDSSFPITVEQVVLMGRLHKYALLPFYSMADKVAAAKAMDQVRINDLATQQFGALSGGQKQRVLIARALVNDPKLLLLDEPVASVDSTVEQDIYATLETFNKEITLLMVSHDLGFVSSYVNKVACVNKTLAIHDTEEISSANMDELYKGKISMIKHTCGL